MRGKLRDKRAVKRDVLKRDVIERKRLGKHETRLAPWLNQDDEQDDELLENEGEDETVITILPQPQPQKK